MEPLTHMLTGAVLARAGVHRRTAYAVAAMTIAAEFPDIDVLWSLGGPVTGFEHHRGLTHTFLGAPIEAALITAAFLLWDRLRKPPKRPSPAPLRPVSLFAGTLLALLSHILLDWTNNYGVHPFLPFDPHWYAGSFVYIVEPVLLVILAAALVLPVLFGLINAEVGARRQRFVSPTWSYAGLILIGALYALRWHERNNAIDLISETAPRAERIFANPHPVNPFEWTVIAEGPGSDQLWTVDQRRDPVGGPELTATLYKPAPSAAITAAETSYLGRVYLDWSMFPILDATPDTTDPRHPLVRVTFSDARYLDGTPLTSSGNATLSGSVLIDPQAPAGQQVVETRLGGRTQHQLTKGAKTVYPTTTCVILDAVQNLHVCCRSPRSEDQYRDSGFARMTPVKIGC